MTTKSEWPKGYALRQFEVIDSTNEEAKRLAATGEAGPVWITAGKQSAGRGRRGRSWVSPVGNLFATLLIRPDRRAAECAQLSFAAALAVSDTIARHVPAEIRVKWPNDVLVDGRKVAGILLESASTSGEVPSWLAVGIGINLAHFPPDTEFPATSLAALTGRAPSTDEVLATLAAAFAKWYEVWRGGGFAPIRDAWLARAAGLGTRIRARLQNEEIWGVFEGIDRDGALILREGQGRTRTIAAGEVFFPQ